MRRLRRVFVVFLLLSTVAMLSGSMGQYANPTARGETGIAQQLPPYSGPKARVTVARFEWKAGGGSEGRTTIRGFGERDITITEERSRVMTGLRDMLTTVLVQSGRDRVFERQGLGGVKGKKTP